jgi:hypothetical protein
MPPTRRQKHFEQRGEYDIAARPPKPRGCCCRVAVVLVNDGDIIEVRHSHECPVQQLKQEAPHAEVAEDEDTTGRDRDRPRLARADHEHAAASRAQDDATSAPDHQRTERHRDRKEARMTDPLTDSQQRFGQIVARSRAPDSLGDAPVKVIDLDPDPHVKVIDDSTDPPSVGWVRRSEKAAWLAERRAAHQAQGGDA